MCKEDRGRQGAHRSAATLSGASSSSCTGKRCSFTSWTCVTASACFVCDCTLLPKPWSSARTTARQAVVHCAASILVGCRHTLCTRTRTSLSSQSPSHTSVVHCSCLIGTSLYASQQRAGSRNIHPSSSGSTMHAPCFVPYTQPRSWQSGACDMTCEGLDVRQLPQAAASR